MLISKFDNFLFDKVSTKPISFIRIIIGFVFFSAFLTHYSHIDYFFVLDGLNHFFSGDKHTFFFQDNHNLIFYFLYSLVLITSLTFMLGLYSRTSAIILFFAVTIFFMQDEWTFWGWPFMARAFLLYLIFTNCNSYWSLDRHLLKKEKVTFTPAWPIRILQIHFCLIYLIPSIIRLTRPSWIEGEEGIRVLIFPLISRIAYLSDYLLSFHSLAIVLGIIVLVVELIVPFFIWFKKTRSIMTYLILFLHVGLLLFSKIPWWQLTMVAASLSFYCIKEKDTL